MGGLRKSRASFKEYTLCIKCCLLTIGREIWEISFNSIKSKNRNCVVYRKYIYTTTLLPGTSNFVSSKLCNLFVCLLLLFFVLPTPPLHNFLFIPVVVYGNVSELHLQPRGSPISSIKMNLYDSLWLSTLKTHFIFPNHSMYFSKSKCKFFKHMFYFGKSTFDALCNSYSSQSIVHLTNVPKYKLIDFDGFSKTAIPIHFKYPF